MTNLRDTVPLMTSPNYKERFRAEYYQTKIRHDKLTSMLAKLEAGVLDFEPDCSPSLLAEQCAVMGRYLHILEQRAKAEGIVL
ncbi:crAss001_48 related protein [uncultured Ruminococcus sp.]|uniref:crAss001_48 related protein n=1 Tax=uncultured Ruminococcus sp. TaxID=165186 RepID=UPI00293095FC|nr:hypothetical protein [uncultured Ruminococcus sp.]